MEEQEFFVNTYPHVLKELSKSVEIHRFSYRSGRPHWLHGEPNIHFHELPLRLRRNVEWDKWFKTLLWFLIAPAIGIWARRQKADMIYLEESLAILALLVQWCSGTPVIIISSDIFWDMYLPKRGPGRWIRSGLSALGPLVWRRLHGIITHTFTFRDYLITNQVDATRVHVVREACEPNFFFPMDRSRARSQFGYSETDVVLMHHGILHPNKGLDRILHFLAPMMQEYPTLRFAITGDGPLRAPLEKQAHALSLSDRVQFLGWLDGAQELNALLNACDISLVMRAGGFSDHFHVTSNLLHSFSCGCCTLAAHLGGIAELVCEGENGLLFDPRDGAEFRAQLTRLLVSQDLRQELAQGALATARQELNPERVRKEWAETIHGSMVRAIQATQVK